MSNILIIKHGSLGDLIQANGAIKDIKNFYKNRKVFLLTAEPYSIFMSECPYLDGVIIDKRLPRWNLFYLKKLKDKLLRYDISKVFDLQNSSRTKFYSRFIIRNVEWSSTETTLETGQKKSDFDQDPVLDRMETQLKKSGIETEFTKNIDLDWATADISRLLKQYANNEYMTNMYFWHPAYDEYPVVGVTWQQCNAFNVWRTQLLNTWRKSHREAYVQDFRLPSETEWEYAARGGLDNNPYPWGGPYARNSRGCFLGNFKPIRGRYMEDGGFHTVKATSYHPNDFGLYCMAGNVAEWC